MSEQKKTFVITRFDPDKDEKPRQQSYEVPVQPDWKVLDGLNYIKDELDGSLSHRWSCRMAVCGSCGMMVNGKPSLTCKDALSSYGDRVEVTPLANFPVVRDLVVEMDGFMEKLKAVKPWIMVAKERAVEEGTYRQSPEELEYFKQFSMCINCMLCYSACPVVGNEPEFLGPAAIALGHRYNMDSRDEGSRRAQRDLPRRGHRVRLLVRERVQRGVPEARRSRGGSEPEQDQRGDRLGDQLRRAARGEVVMARAAHPHSMSPSQPGRTRTAPPQMPPQFPTSGRYLSYTLFGMTGHPLPAVRLRCAARGVDARQRPDRVGGVPARVRDGAADRAARGVLRRGDLRGRALLRAVPEGAAGEDRTGEAAAAADPARGALRRMDRRLGRARADHGGGDLLMRHLLLKLEPVIWLLFGQGIMIGTMLLTAYLAIVGLAIPLGIVPADALSLRARARARQQPVGRVVLFALIALPMWKGAHHVRHLSLDMGGLSRDVVVAPLLYGLALLGNVLALVAVVRL